MALKTVIITGGSSGIGAAAARSLRSEGHRVVITGRSPRTATLAREIGAEHHLVDFSRLDEVRAFARTMLERHERIDALVNNVGGIVNERRVTVDGHEMTLQVNHLSGFLLTSLLRPRLEASRAMVINTSSAAHRYGRLDLDDLESERRYVAMRAYGSAKLMNILHAMEIARRFRGVAAASFHPGVVTTGFAREGSRLVRWFYESFVGRMIMISSEQGADTLLWLLGGRPGRDWLSGRYYYRRRLGRTSPLVTRANAERLWNASERLLERELTLPERRTPLIASAPSAGAGA